MKYKWDINTHLITTNENIKDNLHNVHYVVTILHGRHKSWIIKLTSTYNEAELYHHKTNKLSLVTNVIEAGKAKILNYIR